MIDRTLRGMHCDWVHMPFVCRTLRFQTLGFKAHARSIVGAAKLQRAHTNYPFKLLAAPWHADVRREISIEQHCPRRVDSWSRAFLDQYPDLDDGEALDELVCVNVSAFEDTLRIERRNGTVRQFIIQRSNGQPSIDLPRLNEYLAASHVKSDQARAASADKADARNAAAVVKPKAFRSSSVYSSSFGRACLTCSSA